jgi:hypothetical protein
MHTHLLEDSVALVDDEVLHTTKLEVAALDQGEQTSGCADDDVLLRGEQGAGREGSGHTGAFSSFFWSSVTAVPPKKWTTETAGERYLLKRSNSLEIW